MKKNLLLLIAIAFCLTVTAQEDKFIKAMEPKVAAIDTVRTSNELVALSASFERIADAEKTKWQPYYYAALAQVNAAYFMGPQNMKADKTDPMADRAEMLLNKADALNPNNS